MKKLLLSTLIIGFISPSFAASLTTQKAYAASIIGANLCNLRKGKLTQHSFILNVENLMLKKGYDLDLLFKDNVKKAGRLIANKLGSNCADQRMVQDEDFIYEVLEILR